MHKGEKLVKDVAGNIADLNRIIEEDGDMGEKEEKFLAILDAIPKEERQEMFQYLMDNADEWDVGGGDGGYRGGISDLLADEYGYRVAGLNEPEEGEELSDAAIKRAEGAVGEDEDITLEAIAEAFMQLEDDDAIECLSDPRYTDIVDEMMQMPEVRKRYHKLFQGVTLHSDKDTPYRDIDPRVLDEVLAEVSGGAVTNIDDFKKMFASQALSAQNKAEPMVIKEITKMSTAKPLDKVMGKLGDVLGNSGNKPY